MPTPTAIPFRRKCLFAAAATFIGLFLIACALELTVRVRRGKLTDFRTIHPPRYQWLRDMPCDYDPNLGFVPRPGAWRWGGDHWLANVGPDRLRVNPILPALAAAATTGATAGAAAGIADARPVLLVGDSFTFGNEVNDDQTWAAHLQARLAQTVLNAGVFAHGFDQFVLRAETLIPLYRPKLVLLCFIGDDVSRAELSYSSAWKPWFDLTNDARLIRHNVPVPREPAPEPPLAALHEVLGHSHLADVLLRRAAPDWWRFTARRREHDRGVAVAAALARRLDEFARSHDARLVVVGLGVQPHFGGNARVHDVLEQLRPDGIACANIARELEAAIHDDPRRHASFFAVGGHYSPAGNRWTADRIADALQAAEKATQLSPD